MKTAYGFAAPKFNESWKVVFQQGIQLIREVDRCSTSHVDVWSMRRVHESAGCLFQWPDDLFVLSEEL
ncbi:MAG: hypothetical protein R3C03_20845 [Pirellulaceae bacterium]